MAYPHEAFPFMDQSNHGNMYFQHPMQYVPFMQQPQPHPDLMYQRHPFSDYADFCPLGVMLEDYDDSAEVSTRPRLTKEQVEVLEAQFQSHPKPNSMVKKQLAHQTKLSLPRVANWFQNRRAKAKQQRKQEEFENSRNSGMTETWKNDCNLADALDESSKSASPARRSSTNETKSEVSTPKSPVKSLESFKEASWATLQRALGAAKATQQISSARGMLPPSALPRPNTSTSQQASQQSHNQGVSPSPAWSQAQNVSHVALSSPVPTPTHIQDAGFDFGFGQDGSFMKFSNSTDDSSEIDLQNYMSSTSDWPAVYQLDVASTRSDDLTTVGQTSPLPLPAYPDSRRGSSSDELTANLNTFDLAGTPPIAAGSSNSVDNALRATDGEIDIASRRKRPRPAALTSASLRSRSYGALSSTSPAFRPGPPSGNTLRHVKSTGHPLNSHYAGIRKPSVPQKSPLNLGSFAEAEAFRKLMAQQAAAAASKTPLTTPSGTEVGMSSMSQEMAAQLGLSEDNCAMSLPSEMIPQYQQMQSPPHTPFQAEYMIQPSSASMPPPSVRAQFATFAEYTPPYSAGPLTNSTCSWSDAPLHSPDIAGFPPGHYMSSLAFAQQQDPIFQQWVLPSDNSTDMSLQQAALIDENKKTEFFITEFPGQKEEYASIAQHISPPKPKNYVFANTAPSDYDG